MTPESVSQGELTMSVQQKLIYDLGVHHGDDTEFYLRKGFQVIGVEADPMQYESVRNHLSEYIQDGRLTLLNVGIWESRGSLTFYRNLDNDHWSSFDANYGCREGSRFEQLKIPCVLIEDLLLKYGVPYYMK